MWMRATMGPAKMMAWQRCSSKWQTGRTPESSDRRSAVWQSSWCYAIFAWFDDNIAMYRRVGALGKWLFVIRTCTSLFSPTLTPLDSHAFVYAFAVLLFFDLFWMALLCSRLFIFVLNSVFFLIWFDLFCLNVLYLSVFKCQLMEQWVRQTHNEKYIKLKLNQTKWKSIQTQKKCKCDHFLVRINTVDQRDSNPFSLRCFVVLLLLLTYRVVWSRKNTFRGNGAHLIP